MINGSKCHFVDTRKQRIVASHYRHLRRNPDLFLLKRIQYAESNHIIESHDSCNIPGLLKKLPGQVIADLIFRINVSHGQIHFFSRRLNDDAVLKSCFFIFLQEALHPFGTLLLPGCKRRRYISYLVMSQLQKMPCHNTAKL